jgi:hypothetical protein
MKAALRDKRRAAAIARAAELPPTPVFRTADGCVYGGGEAFKVVSRVYEPGAGGVFRTADGCVYGVGMDGSIHVARDENGKRLRPPRARGIGATASPEPEPIQVDSRVAAPVEVVPPGATSSDLPPPTDKEWRQAERDIYRLRRERTGDPA